ncbi:MAG: undecaprenyl/decaprenyl-phosphate alpha-N-acetylglucosaminyl 1-phosphate transferase [Nitrospira sp.]|nr:undecaprenyl/decaprenyl-phosphate alpha-N-acetylglucosaminyl 1-phosphate transferase [Nitrospira sp.]
MNSALFFSCITSLLISMALIPPLRLLAERFRFVDLPGDRKVHKHPIPSIGGIALAVGSFAGILWWCPQSSIKFSLLLGGLIILGFGVWDDRVNLGYRVKLLGQLLAALVIVFVGEIRFESALVFVDGELPLWMGAPLTVFFLIAVSNAVNLTDGLDGLAGGLSFLTLCGIAYLAYLASDSTVLLLTVPFLGGVLGFLRYNTYPARIFMGDGGSQLLGFTMGVLAILLTNSTRGPFSPAVSLFLLGLPFLDTLGVAGQRLAEGRSPFIGDRTHIHHKLMRIGLSHYEAVMAIYAVQIGMVGLAYLLRWQSDVLIVSLYLGIAGSVLGGFIAAGRGLLPSDASQEETLLSRVAFREFSNGPSNGPWMASRLIWLLAIAVPIFLVGLVFFSSDVPPDVGYLSLILFGVVLLGLLLPSQASLYFVRGGLYVATTFLLYVFEGSRTSSMPTVAVANNIFFVVLTFTVVMILRFDEQNRFQTTPLDYLMVFLAVSFPLLPEVRTDFSHLGVFAAKLIVLFFSFELLLHAFAGRARQLGFVSLWILFGLGIRMLL